MKTRALVGAIVLSCGAACSLLGGGLESQECKDYFAKVEECAGKATAKGTPAAKTKADAWVKGAAISKENFEKNANPMAVSKSCEMMLEQLKSDSDCQ